MMRFPLSLTAVALLVSGCHDPASTHEVDADAGPDASVTSTAAIAPAPGRVKWRLKLQGDYSLHSPGVAADGTIYVAVAGGKLYAISPTGTQKWVIPGGASGGLPAPISVASDGTIYAASDVVNPGGSGATGAVLALTPAGAVKWTFGATGGGFLIAGPSIGPDGNIYAVAEFPGIGLFSLTPAGQLRFSTGSFGEYGPLGEEMAFGSGQVYFAFDMAGMGQPSSLFGYTFAGARKFQVPAANNGQPDVGPNGNVVVENFPSNVGLSLTGYSPTGTTNWSYYQFPGNTEEHPDVGPDNTAYTVRNLGTLLALDAQGQQKWTFVDTTIMFMTRVRPQNDLLFMGGRITYGMPGYFQTVSTTGTPLWRVTLPDEPGFAPYGQLVPMTNPVFSPDGNTGYGVTDVAGDGANPYCFLYAIDLTPGTGGGGNTVPSATLTATTATTIRPGGSVTFRGSFTDPDTGDNPWTYLWKFGNGQITGTRATPGTNTRTRTYPKAGTFTVTFRVTDARGGVGTSNPVVVTVR